MKAFVITLMAMALTVSATFFIGDQLAYRHNGPISDHFDGKYFYNLSKDPKGKRSALDFFKWLFNRNLEDWQSPPVNADQSFPDRSQSLHVTWVNHASVLIQIDNINILTDPTWAERAGPLSWVGPKRLSPPGVLPEDLPPIDIVIISHNHYDHLHIPSLETINRLHRPLFIMPIANRYILPEMTGSTLKELDWFESFTHETIEITATPAQHWSKRTPFDANRSLWSGYFIKGENQSIFFAGDSAYDKHFKLIREKLGSPDMALIPIGAYKPRWFMKGAHTNPEEAVLVHEEMGASMSIPIHYGTFQLGDDSPPSALADLEQAMIKHGIDASRFKVLALGETVALPVE